MRKNAARVLALLLLVVSAAGCASIENEAETPLPPSESSDVGTQSADPSPNQSSTYAEVQPIETVWSQYLGAMIAGDVPRLLSFRSDSAVSSFAEGDMDCVCDSVSDLGVEVSGDEAYCVARFHVVEFVWSTGDREAVDRDIEYEVHFRREADGVWRVVEMPDGIFTLR